MKLSRKNIFKFVFVVFISFIVIVIVKSYGLTQIRVILERIVNMLI